MWHLDSFVGFDVLVLFTKAILRMSLSIEKTEIASGISAGHEESACHKYSMEGGSEDESNQLNVPKKKTGKF